MSDLHVHISPDHEVLRQAALVYNNGGGDSAFLIGFLPTIGGVVHDELHVPVRRFEALVQAYVTLTGTPPEDATQSAKKWAHRIRETGDAARQWFQELPEDEKTVQRAIEKAQSSGDGRLAAFASACKMTEAEVATELLNAYLMGLGALKHMANIKPTRGQE